MLIVDDCIISDNLADVCFCCDIEACHGACCVEGDSGAPLDDDEEEILRSILPRVSSYMSPAGRAVVERVGVAVRDSDGDLGTPLIDGGECAYSVQQDGKTLCAIEMACRAGDTEWLKPISCHLYPVRIEDYGEFKAVNYHEWDICKHAVVCRKQNSVPLYVYLREPLIRRFGKQWYDELVVQCANRNN